MSTPEQDEVATRILGRLNHLAGRVDGPGSLHRLLATTRTADDLRDYLRSRGWNRRDRSGERGPRELWLPPSSPCGMQPICVPLASAVRQQLKADGYIGAGFGRLG